MEDRPTVSAGASSGSGILSARPTQPSFPGLATGTRRLGLSTQRDGFIYVPPSNEHSEPRPLLVFFHGSGGSADQAEPLLNVAAEHRVVVLSIDSRAPTWDLIAGELGPDVEFLDEALRFTFERHWVDRSRVAVSGFSDGASYALSIGLANGDLFSHALAFSPGFASPPRLSGSPDLFVSHGVSDNVLPIDACSRRIVPGLERTGYRVRYLEFEGGHAMPRAIVSEAFAWAF